MTKLVVKAWPDAGLYRADETSTYPTGRRWARLSRPSAFAVVTGLYAVAGAVAALTWALLPGHHPVTVALAADVVATVVVFALSMLLANSSVYDPYWSVAPPLVALAWAVVAPGAFGTARQVVVLVLVIAWAVRLTGNWAIGWHGLQQEDWRYIRLRDDSRGRLPWWLVSFGGIQLMPTLVVFLGLLPLWPALGAARHGFGALDVVATIVTVVAIVVETVADNQMRAFTRTPAARGRSMTTGLWSRSRHPNYLGEITFWWGLWLFGMAADPSWWWTVVGPLVMVALFETASIPMMEQRSTQRRADYGEYQQRVPRLLPVRLARR
jgi:steroid 5-alpha reductase family enzyme